VSFPRTATSQRKSYESGVGDVPETSAVNVDPTDRSPDTVTVGGTSNSEAAWAGDPPTNRDETTASAARTWADIHPGP
jgi:hypothetical protein